jgi:hypothetical protein
MKPLVKGENFFSETYSGAKIRGVTAITKVRFAGQLLCYLLPLICSCVPLGGLGLTENRDDAEAEASST